MVRELYIVENRIVVTYQPEGWPAGVLTGFVNAAGGFVLEHVISLNPTMLIPMLTAAIEEATNRHYRYIRFGIPRDFPIFKKLEMLALRLNFKFRDADSFQNWYMREL